MKKIITIQHTESVHHNNGMIGSLTDWELSERGHQQAQRLANRLAQTINSEKWKIYTSDLKRAYQTAEYLAKELDLSLQLQPELRERDLGEAVGKSVEWFKERLTPEKTVYDRLISTAESRSDKWKRLTPLVKAINESHENNIVLVSHGDCLSIFYAIWLGLSVEDLTKINLYGEPCGVSFLYDDGQKKSIRRLSDMSFVMD